MEAVLYRTRVDYKIKLPDQALVTLRIVEIEKAFASFRFHYVYNSQCHTQYLKESMAIPKFPSEPPVITLWYACTNSTLHFLFGK